MLEEPVATNDTRTHQRDAPLVSIALCTYNGARFLRQQLDSLLAQTWPHIEILVADDGSSDGTAEILQDYARRDSRFSVTVNSNNLGFARNFQALLTRCTGAYIAPCDQDDIWLPEKIARLIDALGARELAFCDSTLIDEHGAASGPRMSDIVPMQSSDDPAPFAFGNCVSGHAMLFRRELVARAMPVPDEFFYDWWLAAVAASATGMVFCASSLVLYRQHGRNVTDGRLSEMIAEAGITLPATGNAAGPAADKLANSHAARLRYLHDTERRLASLASLPGKHQSFVAELHRLWSARKQQWISPALGWFMSTHRKRLLALTRMPEKKQRRYCRKFFRGLRSL